MFSQLNRAKNRVVCIFEFAYPLRMRFDLRRLQVIHKNGVTPQNQSKFARPFSVLPRLRIWFLQCSIYVVPEATAWIDATPTVFTRWSHAACFAIATWDAPFVVLFFFAYRCPPTYVQGSHLRHMWLRDVSSRLLEATFEQNTLEESWSRACVSGKTVKCGHVGVELL